ncbi:MAG: ParB/RepB/Spo0J family partition protein [Roseburia sp.]
MAKRNLGERIKLQSYDEMFGLDTISPGDQKQEGQIVNIPLNELYEFKDHPFRVLDDEKMEETVESIKEHGVLMPGIARPRKEGGYEIISGHRRRRASELAGKTEMPFIIKDYSDDEATVIMVDSNIQREDILISEKAKAYHMKYMAMKHQGTAGGISLDVMSEQTGESQKTVQRYIYLARLTDELLGLVDAKKLGVKQGVEISSLDTTQQEIVYKVLSELGSVIDVEQATRIKEAGKKGYLNEAYLRDMLTYVKPPVRKVVFNQKKLDSYFDPTTSNSDIEDLIVKLLDEWKEKGGQL